MATIAKNALLADPRIKQLYMEYSKRMQGSGRMKGAGVWDNFVRFLKDSKIISTVGKVILPAAGGALAALGTANPLGLAAGAALGSAANNYIASQGFGRKRKMKGRGYLATPLQLGRGTSAYGSISSEYGKVKF